MIDTCVERSIEGSLAYHRACDQARRALAGETLPPSRRARLAPKALEPRLGVESVERENEQLRADLAESLALTDQDLSANLREWFLAVEKRIEAGAGLKSHEARKMLNLVRRHGWRAYLFEQELQAERKLAWLAWIQLNAWYELADEMGGPKPAGRECE